MNVLYMHTQKYYYFDSAFVIDGWDCVCVCARASLYTMCLMFLFIKQILYYCICSVAITRYPAVRCIQSIHIHSLHV